MSSKHPSDESERFFKKYRKEERQDRKLKQANDSSKHKKTDLAKHPKKNLSEIDESKSVVGLVIRVVSNGYIVEYESKEYLTMIRGTLKEKENADKNLVTIGDNVRFVPKDDQTGWIVAVLPRKSALVRQGNLLREKRQFIAANVDQVFICASIVDPPLKPNLIDRYIISAEKGNIKPIVVVNKCELGEFNLAEKELLDELERAYKIANIPLIRTSAEENIGLDEIKALMKGKISVFSGQSGVGKSSLINALLGTDLEVGVTTRIKKGSHTTTHALLLPIDNGYCIDTPGIKSFGVWALNDAPIDHYFPEIFKYKEGCKFRDCTHTHEDGCNVIKMVEEGSISPIRYESYLSLLDEDSTRR